jgi:hypothetical protein
MENLMNRKLLIISLLTVCILVVACETKPINSPARPVEIYLQSMVDNNYAVMSRNSCEFWQENVQQDHDTFENVVARTEGLSCSVITETEGFAEIACEGAVIANFNGQESTFPLNARNYLALKTDGVWQFCGYP